MSIDTIEFQTDSSRICEFSPHTLIVAGWTGRDKAAVARHIEELDALGVPPPSITPLFYRVSGNLLTTAARIQVVGEGTSGEVEPLLVSIDDELYVGLVSDHTDRDLESHSVALSKQACTKPVSRNLWHWSEVKPHWDELVIRCWILEGDREKLYQEGHVAQIIHPSELMAQYKNQPEILLTGGEGMLCGTLPVIGGIRPASAYRMELSDPVLKRSIELSYEVDVLPMVS